MERMNEYTAHDFTCTRWSMVQRLRAPRPAEARRAIVELALRYWYPVYAYVRRCGHSPEVAQDITRAFFQQLSAETSDDGGAAPRGRFRDWLLARLNAFLAGDWQDNAGAAPQIASPPLAELERNHRDDHLRGDSPEQAFQRGFALEVLARGFKSLQSEVRQTGRIDMYEALEPYLSRDPLPGQYEEIGRRLGIRPVALVLALKRLRQRLRELVRDELADAVSSPRDMAVEQQTLYAALAREP